MEEGGGGGGGGMPARVANAGATRGASDVMCS
jgi:hypothetical protein